jgi:hypothetical protein
MTFAMNCIPTTMPSSPTSPTSPGRGQYKPEVSHLPGRNYFGPSRALLEGLAQRPLGFVDNRSLRFVGAAEAGNTADLDQGKAPLSESEVTITDVQPLGSFNWSKEEGVDVLIPGMYLIFFSTCFRCKS